MVIDARSWIFAIFLSVVSPTLLLGQIEQFANIRKLNRQLNGHVDDYTRNHGRFNRITSDVLEIKQDLYVYTPPGYCKSKCYPLVLWLHGAFGDEHAFFVSAQLEYLDEQISNGCLPPMIIACPDGTCNGRNFVLAKHSFYVNGQCGCYRDNLTQEIVPFLINEYSISPCRHKHAVVGVSAGGLGAMSLAIRCSNYFGSVATLSGALNLRYYNSCKDYSRDFDPQTFRWRQIWDPDEVIGVIGPISIRARTFISPVFGDDSQTIKRIQCENPADVLCRSELVPGQLHMLVAYGCKDEFNFDAQAESFVYLARQKGLEVDVLTDPQGEHASDFFQPMQRRVYHWLGRQFCDPCSTVDKSEPMNVHD